MKGPRPPRVPPEATETRRQRLVELLGDAERGFEELRQELLVKAATLEEDLRHVERSLRRAGRRLRVVPAACAACGFCFRERSARHFHPPSRCPRCRSERIHEPRFRLSPG